MFPLYRTTVNHATTALKTITEILLFQMKIFVLSLLLERTISIKFVLLISQHTNCYISFESIHKVVRKVALKNRTIKTFDSKLISVRQIQ